MLYNVCVEKHNKEMKMLDSETIGIRLKKTEANRLRELAREIAFKEHRTITISGLIKEAIKKAYPEK